LLDAVGGEVALAEVADLGAGQPFGRAGERFGGFGSPASLGENIDGTTSASGRSIRPSRCSQRSSDRIVVNVNNATFALKQ